MRVGHTTRKRDAILRLPMDRVGPSGCAGANQFDSGSGAYRAQSVVIAQVITHGFDASEHNRCIT